MLQCWPQRTHLPPSYKQTVSHQQGLLEILDGTYLLRVKQPEVSTHPTPKEIGARLTWDWAFRKHLRAWGTWKWEVHELHSPPDCSCGATRNLSSMDVQKQEIHSPPGTICSQGRHELSSLNLGSAWDACPMLDCVLTELLDAWASWTWKAQEMYVPSGIVPLWSTHEPETRIPPWSGAICMWSIHCEHFTHMPAVFVCSFPSSPQHNWTSETE